MESYWAPRYFQKKPPHPAELRYEGTRVEMLLEGLSLSHRASELWYDFERRWGVKRLTFEGFDRIFDTFPWQLTSKSIYKGNPIEDRLSLRSWYLGFTRSPAWSWYRKYEDSLDVYRRKGALFVDPLPWHHQDRPLGMIFPVARIKGGVILHNGPALTRAPKFVFMEHDIRGDLMQYHIELYANWVQAIAKSGWTPDSPIKNAEISAVVAEPARRGAWVEPWIAQRLGGFGNEAVLLAWLCRILLTEDPGRYERSFRGRWDGVPCVDATKAKIAEHTGISNDRQVAAALSRLRKEGLIVTKQTLIYLIRNAVDEAMEPGASA